MSDRIHRRVSPKQSGVVLITGLIFMVILTMIVLAVLRSGTLEERMAANARNRQLALQAAEAVLRHAEDRISAGIAPFDPLTVSAFTPDCTTTSNAAYNGYCNRPPTTPRWKALDWTDDSSKTRTFSTDTDKETPDFILDTALVASPPRYAVEMASTPIISPSAGGGLCPNIVYRITARGVGMDSAEVFVQSIYRARPSKC